MKAAADKFGGFMRIYKECVKMKKFVALTLAAILCISQGVCAFAGEPLTKGEYTRIVFEKARDYNPNLSMEDLVKSSETSKPVTKVEALAILKRAFGKLPILRGDLLRTAPEATTYTDLPAWAQEDINSLSQAGVLSEEGNILGAGDSVDMEYTDIMLGRMYRLFASNPKDDFYYTLNRDYLMNSTIPDGAGENSVYSKINNQVGEDIAEILLNTIKTQHKNGTAEQKIKDFYLSAANEKQRNEQGIKPIKAYLDRLEKVKNDKELEAFAIDVAKDTTVDYLLGFGVTEDINEKGKYLPILQIYEATLPVEEYTKEDSRSLEGLKKYMIKAYTLAGNSKVEAEKKTDMVIEFEKEIAAKSMSNEELTDIENVYNYYTPKQIDKKFSSVDTFKIAAAHGFNLGDKVLVTDTGAMECYSKLFDGKHTELLKAMVEISMLSFYSNLLSSDFLEASNILSEAVYGYNPDDDVYNDAFNSTASLMSEYLGRVYCEQHFTEQDKKDIEAIVQNLIAVYKERIQNLDWLSDKTKAEALKKLDNMKIVIGMPESGLSLMDNVKITRDSYVDNIYAVLKENDRMGADILSGKTDVNDISFSPYMVNAAYYPNYNAIVLPAGILRKPIYDKDAPAAQNYGAIGYIVGHEISHAFDTSGASFDENGRFLNWWEDEDYKAFEALSQKAVDYYDGAEAATGLEVNGTLTLNENIADIAGIEAALDALKKVEKEPDYKTFFKSFANMSQYTATRTVVEYDLISDVHSPASIRANYAVKSTDEFYEAYDVKEGDGMYVPEDERIRIW